MIIEAIKYVLKTLVLYHTFSTIFALITSIIIYKIVPLFYKPNFNQYKGRWTVVTGGTDGIGKAYLMELAERGLRKFILIGRSEKKLELVKSTLEESYSAKVKTFLFDFYDGDYAKLRNYVENFDIGFAVNSVGVGRKLMEEYGENPADDYRILRVNGIGSAEFLSIVISTMEKHGGGQVVVLSSSQGEQPIPYLAAYSASKALLSFLCEAANRERKRVDIQCLCPALVATSMTFYKDSSYFIKNPADFVKEAVNTVGISSKTSGCFNHEIQMLLAHLLPWSILKYLILPIYYYQRDRVRKMHGNGITDYRIKQN